MTVPGASRELATVLLGHSSQFNVFELDYSILKACFASLLLL
jgi:hypothetical protein